VFLAEILDVGAAGFEDPQPKQAEQTDQREVVQVDRVPGRAQQRLQLQVGQPEGGRVVRHRRPAHMLGGRAGQHAVDDTVR